MVFRHCIIGSKVYMGDSEHSQEENVPQTQIPQGPPPTAEETLSGAGSSSSGAANNNDALALPSIPPERVVKRFRDASLAADLEESVQADPKSDHASHARSLNGFFTVLALCHTVLAVVGQESNTIEYKAQSPDEAALVQAAADVGFVFRGRDHETLILQTPFSDEPEKYELLHILEFTSARKRMSVVLRKLDGNDERLFLLTKGADNVIFERLKSGGEELKETVGQQLAAFASEGLRTLTLAYKIISSELISE